MSIGRVVSTTLTSTISKGGRTIQVAYVKQTDIWTRSFIDPGVQRKFTALVEENIDTFSSDTTVVALQETPHESKRDHRTHFTGVELNGKGDIVKRRHFKVR